MEKACDYLLIGQGLAGTSLAVHLLELGADVRIMDDRRRESSSRVAAGLYNPVTGRKMVKTWMADSLFPYLEEYYRHTERMTKASFLHSRPIYRPFLSVEEQNEWMGKSASADFEPYVAKVHTTSFLSGIEDPFGGVLLRQCGYLDIPAYLDAMGDWFDQQGILIRETLKPEDLVFEDGWIRTGSLRARKIIFCDGTSAVSNTFFNWLPFRPVKGELLEVSLDAELPVIVNRGVFVLQVAPGSYRVGSTYNNRDTDWQPTQDGKAYLLDKLNSLVHGTPQVISHYAGVRPATADRRPVMGMHPDHETIGLFNGLGTKGVSLSPWFGKHLSAHLVYEKPLSGDVNISRYFSLY